MKCSLEVEGLKMKSRFVAVCTVALAAMAWGDVAAGKFHARNAGTKTLRLPCKTTVVDVFARELVAKDVDTFTFEAPLHSSWLFYCGDDAEELLGKIQ